MLAYSIIMPNAAAANAPSAVVWVSGRNLVAVAAVEGTVTSIVGSDTGSVTVDFMEGYEEFVVPCLVNLRLEFPHLPLSVQFPRSSLLAVWPPSSSSFSKKPSIMLRLLRVMEDTGSRAALTYSFEDAEGFPPEFRMPHENTGTRFTDPASSLSYGCLCEVMVDSFACACRSVGFLGDIPGIDLRARIKDTATIETFESVLSGRKRGTPLSPDVPISVACVYVSCV